MSTYATPEDLRDFLGLDSGALDDAAAEVVLEDAEDAIDRLIGAAGVDTVTGRKVTLAGVQAWRVAKLKRATLTIARVLHADPSALQSRPGQNVKGPDFEVSTSVVASVSPAGTEALRRAAALLDTAYFRRLTVRTR